MDGNLTARRSSCRAGTYYFLGLDLGKVQDPAAIAVAEVPKPDIHIRHLERLPLGTPYPKVIERVTAIIEKLPSPDLIVDATGVGRPVIDQMRETGLEPVPVTITGGRFMSFDGDMWRVPKKALLRPLVAASEAGRLKVAKEGAAGSGSLPARVTGIPEAHHGAGVLCLCGRWRA